MSRLVSLALAVGCCCWLAPPGYGGEASIPLDREVSVVFDLAPPAGDANRFEVDTALHTLVPGRDVERASGAVQWSGQLELSLHLGEVGGDGLPTVDGIELPATNLAIVQSPISLLYQNLPVDVQFVTSELTTSFSHASEPPVTLAGSGSPGRYEFSPAALQLTQSDGTASVMVPLRPTETQHLGAEPAQARAGEPDPMQSEMASVVLEVLEQHESAISYQATFELPLAGSGLHFPGTGLPVDWQYTTGHLLATGNFTLDRTVIPEPTGLALFAGLLLAGSAARLRTVG